MAVSTKSENAVRQPKTRERKPRRKVKLDIDKKALKKLELVAVAYSHVEREWFPTQDAYEAEREVEERAHEVEEAIEKLGIKAKAYRGDQYFLTNLLIDDPNLVLNLVDTLRGKDALQTSIPAALELANIPYTGAEMQGLVIGNNRHLIKQLLTAYEIPTPAFQYITRTGTSVDKDLRPPLIVKLNESGGSVGIDNKAVQETLKDAQRRVDELLSTYKVPVIVERFIDGPEITVVIFEDSKRRHMFMGQKIFQDMPDGKHYFTSIESYRDEDSYSYKPVAEALESKITRLANRAYTGLLFRDFAKFDIRLHEKNQTPYFTDCNPNTAFGPDMGLPFTEILALHGITFEEVLASLLSKYAKKIK